MSSYNNGDVRTDYIDPQIYVPNGRASFDLDASKLAYLPNMRLLNVGVTASAAGTYNRLVGSMSVIRNIRLLDGRTELSALRNPVPYLGFKSQQRTNGDNISSGSWLKNSRTGLQISDLDEQLDHVYNGDVADVGQPAAAANPTSVGYLDLREVFPLLNALPALPTSVFPNLRVEVEFESAAGTKSQIVNATTDTFTSVRPILAVDVIENDDLVAALTKAIKDNGARWNEIEHDRYNIKAPDANVAGATQPDSSSSMGYIGKRVERLLMVKTLQDPLDAVNTTANQVIGYGNAASQAFKAQKTQVRLNGKNVFPGFGGITRPMERLALISDEYGACSAYPGSVYTNWSNADKMMDLNVLSADGNTRGILAPLTGKAFAGALSYDCVRIGARVADLQIQISRDATGNTKTATSVPYASHLACNINLYAEVDKVMVMGRDGQYRIVYA